MPALYSGDRETAVALAKQNIAALLADHPQLGRPGRSPGTREWVVTRFSYILPYRARGETVEILRVFHTARKWPQGFGE